MIRGLLVSSKLEQSIIQTMFEDKSSNSFEVTRNDKENGGNRLMAHFQNSGFLAQQQELSLFIKNLPLIRIEEVHSLNLLIELLIRQNQVLGAKCQQNVLTVKQMFSKHEELIRTNRNLQQQIAESSKMVQYNSVNQKQIDSYEQQLTKAKEELAKAKEEITNLKAEQTKMKIEGNQRQQAMVRLSQQTQQLITRNERLQQSLKQGAEILQLISQRGFKKCIQRVRELGNTSQKWVEWNEIQRFAREERKRIKCMPKVRETVEVFCSRLFRVVELVGASGVRDQFQREVSNLLDILDDLLHLRRKNSLVSSQSRMEGIQSESGFFQAMLGKLIKQSQSGGTARQQIAGELNTVRQELQECKNYYQKYLIDVRLQFETIVREKDEELVEKRQLVQFYQQQRERISKEQKQWQAKLTEWQQKMKVERANMQIRQQQIISLQGKLQFARSQGAMREKQLREQWQQNMKTYQYKLNQKQELVEQEQKQRRFQKGEFQQILNQLKGKVHDLQQKENSLNQLNRELAEGNRQLSEVLKNNQKKAEEEISLAAKEITERNRLIEEINRKRERQLLQIKKLKEENEELQKEKSLQATYIKQLQAKSKEVVAKIKTIQNKKSQEKTAKKEISAIKQTMLEQKKYTRQVEQSLQTQREQAQKQRQDNQRLKSVIKEMKKELEAVYLQFTDLKQIESDRERLLIDMQKSDRSKQEIIRSWESAKAELIRLQTQNRGLSLEVKHYRNALSRIEALRS